MEIYRKLLSKAQEKLHLSFQQAFFMNVSPNLVFFAFYFYQKLKVKDIVGKPKILHSWNLKALIAKKTYNLQLKLVEVLLLK